MYARVSCWLPLTFLVLVGCASGTVGPRAGIDVPIGDAAQNVSVVAGATVEGRLATVGLRVDPQFRMIGSEQRPSIMPTESTTVDVAMTTSTTIVDLPVMVIVGRERPDLRVKPYLNVGLMLSAPVTQSTSIKTVSTFVVPEGTFQAPSYGSSTISEMDDIWFSLIACGGVRYTLTPRWELRGEARMQYLLSDAELGTAYVKVPGGTGITLSNVLPSLSLGLHIALVMRL